MPESSQSGLRFADIKDIPPREAVAQMHGTRRAGVHLRVLEWNANWFVSHTRYDPGLILARHAHNSDSTVFILEGELRVDDRLCPAGTLITLDRGVFFGPLIAGPDGCTLLESYAGDVTSVHEDEAAYQRLLAAHGVTPTSAGRETSGDTKG